MLYHDHLERKSKIWDKKIIHQKNTKNKHYIRKINKTKHFKNLIKKIQICK